MAPTSGWLARLRPHGWALSVLMLCQLGQVTASLLLPGLSADIIDKGIAAGAAGTILGYGGWMAAASLAQLVLSVAAVVLGARIAFQIGQALRADVFAKVHSLALAQVQSFSIGSLITRCTNDVLQVQTMLTMILVMIVIAPIMGIGGGVMALRQDVQLSRLLLIVVPVLALIIGYLTLRATPLFQRMQAQLDGVNTILREQIDGIRVIRAFLQEDRESRRFGAANNELTATALHAGRLMATISPAVTAVMQLASVALVWAGAGRIISGDLQIGALISFLSYVSLILISVMMMGMLVVLLPRALVSARRIGELLRSEVMVGPPARPQALPAKGTGLPLRFEAVSFGYPGAEAMVLEAIDFAVDPGEVLGIIGATGSGKSTIVNLIARLDDPTTGRILLGGVDRKTIAPEALNGRIGYVPQKTYLFSGSVADSLRFGNPQADDAALWRALEIAQAADFIRALPEQLAAPVAQGGTNFSGGQRQRLAIARALVCDADLYLFDDSFSALDQATDARLRAELRRATAHAVTVTVSQRVASIKDADRILVLDRGKIAGYATHEALVRDCPIYADIVRSQQGVTEDAA
ncbi:MAG: ABC transporter ATP-binding protein [Brevundimonas sp.]|uniref:ABC transporter ATP-binding protein n=1 Tax=Brevundimonas sp. TaxID=1871086 RepID=UPI002727D484|nr:ABC transporter ATP-binding protein [Brevundimonas sp.]MDO9607921.1 ABC transporter ATP-binding protein [Brevundimonas sp.]